MSSITTTLWHLTSVYAFLEPVRDVYLWVSAHIDTSSPEATVCCVAREGGRAVIVDVRTEPRGGLLALRTMLAIEIGMLAAHPLYKEATVHIYMDANPLQFVHSEVEALSPCKQVRWIYAVAGMNTEPGVSINYQMRKAAWTALPQTQCFRVLNSSRALLPNNQLATALKAIAFPSTSPSNTAYDVAMLVNHVLRSPPVVQREETGGR